MPALTCTTARAFAVRVKHPTSQLYRRQREAPKRNGVVVLLQEPSCPGIHGPPVRQAAPLCSAAQKQQQCACVSQFEWPWQISSRIRFFSFRFALAGGACRPTTAPAARSCPTPSHGTAPAPRRCWLGCRTWALPARAGTAVCQPSMDLAAFSQRIPASCRLPGAPPAWILMAATLSHQGIHRYGRQITRYMRSACCCNRKERPNRFA